MLHPFVHRLEMIFESLFYVNEQYVKKILETCILRGETLNYHIVAMESS